MIRLDQIMFSTLHEAYKNYANKPGSLMISGNIADGATSTYSVTIPYTRGGTRADVYLDNNDTKILANSSSRLETGDPYQFISLETVSMLIQYTSSSIGLTLSVFNGTGAPITLIPQTIAVSVVEYDAPIISI